MSFRPTSDEHQAPADASLDVALRHVRAWALVLRDVRAAGDNPTGEIAAMFGLDEATRRAHQALDRHIAAGAPALSEAP